MKSKKIIFFDEKNHRVLTMARDSSGSAKYISNTTFDEVKVNHEKFIALLKEVPNNTQAIIHIGGTESVKILDNIAKLKKKLGAL